MQIKIALALVLGMLAGGGAAIYFGRTEHPQKLVAPAGEPTGLEWYFAFGEVVPEGDAPSRDYIVVYNPGREPVSVDLDLFFEGDEPTDANFTVAPRSSGVWTADQHPKVALPGKSYGVRVRTDRPVVVQASRSEFQALNAVPTGIASVMAHPGPLGRRETRWMYADGVAVKGEGPMEEREWLAVLNPGGEPAKLLVRFHTARGETNRAVEVPAERSVNLALAGMDEFPKNVTTAVIVESDQPVIVQQVRRTYAKGSAQQTAVWAMPAMAYGDRPWLTP